MYIDTKSGEKVAGWAGGTTIFLEWAEAHFVPPPEGSLLMRAPPTRSDPVHGSIA